MKTIINIKADKEVKQRAQKIAKELGLPLSTVINAYLKEFIRKKEVTFSVEPRLRPEVGKLLEKASRDYKQGKNVSGPFSTAEEIEAHLKSL